MKREMKRELNEMPFDKAFDVDGNEELCHSTGYEVCLPGYDASLDSSWWNEYIDRNGDFHYGR